MKTSSGADESPLKLREQQPASDEVHRIIPLGLTLTEAKAWYANHILIPKLRRGVVPAIPGLAILILLFTFWELIQKNLVTGLLQQGVLIVAGFLFSDSISNLIPVLLELYFNTSLCNRVNGRERGAGTMLLVFGAGLGLMIFWGLPAGFDMAGESGSAHTVMQLSLLLVGFLFFAGSQSLSRRVKLIAPVAAGKVMGLYGMFLLLTPVSIYSIYPAAEQVYAGVALLIVMCALDFTIVPIWLYRYFASSRPL